MVFRILVLAAGVALSLQASGQQAAAPQAARAVTPHGCKKPGDFPGRLASENNRRNWVKEANDYLACLKKYAMEHQSAAQSLFDQAKPHAEAANAAIDEHNKSATQFKDDQEKGS
jgi:hypothetical protein